MSEAAFDTVATDYDRQFTDTETGRLQRNLVRRFLSDWLSGKSAPRVLELNCGTGADALWLAEQGAEVLATDLSPEMVRVASERGAGTAKMTFQAGDYRQVVQEVKGQFDLVFSNFGGLNCVGPEDLEQLGRDLKRILKPGGLFVAVIMPRFCAWETLYYLVKLKLGEAFRRLRSGPVSAPLGDGKFQNTWYYSPQGFADLLGPNWEKVAQHPVGFFLPPSYLDPFFHGKAKLLQHLGRLEESSFDLEQRASWADHFLLAMQPSS